MSEIDKHVSVTITKETATISRVGFGIPAILTYHTRFPDVYRVYGSLTEMTDDNFTVDDLAYKMAAAMFAQSPRPTKVVVGRRATAPLRDVTLTPRANPLATTAYWVRINGTLFSFTTDATPTVAEITAGLVALIDAGSENVNATDNTTDFDVESADAPGGSATAGVPFIIEFDHAQFEFNDNTADASLDTDFNTLKSAVTAADDFYGIVVDAWDAINIADLAVAVEAAGPKIYAAESQDSDIVESGSSDIASTLKTANYDRTFLSYAYDVDPSPAAGWLGRCLPATPGSITWKFKTLNTVSASVLTTAEIGYADAKNCNTYTTVGGQNMMAEGVMASGEFIDVTRFIDWLTARIKENVFRALKVNDKIPYTDSGIQAITAEIDGVLRQGVFNGGINGDEEIIVTAPLAADVDANDRAGRLLPDIEFLATLAGAIHKVVIAGKVVA
jgi:hypothetical protein